jgi:hypothetical protein
MEGNQMKHIPVRAVVLWVVCLFSLSACGTLVHGTRQNIMISSTPPGGTATVDNMQVETPTFVSLSRTKDYVVTVEKEGCKKGQAYINRRFNGVTTILGNILWLVAGFLVDFVAGGAWTLEPDNVNVQLSCGSLKF